MPRCNNTRSNHYHHTTHNTRQLFKMSHKKIFKIALYALLGSITGAIFAYFIGMYFFDLIGKPIIEFYNFQNELDTFSQNIKDHGFIYVFVGGFSPIPFKLVTLSSGFLGVSFIVFVGMRLLLKDKWNFLIIDVIKICI